MRYFGFCTKAAAIALPAALLAVLLAVLAYAPPPTPHSISGIIFESDGATQVQIGTAYSINETASYDFIRGATSIPVPELSGMYFETISGSDGDTVIAMAWNQTHYGNATITLFGDMENVNIWLNLSRSTETNMTIISPESNSAYNVSSYFNITANISVLGAAGIGCNATISFSDYTVLNISGTDTAVHALGNIALDESVVTSWNVSAQGAINTTATVTSACEQQGMRLEGFDTATIYNVTVLDSQPPNVSLISPPNDAVSGSYGVVFTYNVTEPSQIANCSLLINSTINSTNSTISKGELQTFEQTFNDGSYNWTVLCVDIGGNQGAAAGFNLTVTASVPTITGFSLSDPISLNAGSTAVAWCNATVSNNAISIANITLVNATLFDMADAASSSPDDNNNHYTNSSCDNLTAVGESTDFACRFELHYYANNATWNCNVTATDTRNFTGFSNKTTIVNELVAMDANAVIDYGALPPTNISDMMNLTLANMGNVDINLSVRGYGTLPAGDNLSMDCGADGNIPVTNQRYSAVYGTSYDQMTNLTNQSTAVLNFTLMQKTNDLQDGNEVNKTFWRIMVPEGIGGRCNGTISLLASMAG